MIGRLTGKLVEKKPPWLLIDVGGVGYEVESPMSTIYDLPPTGQNVTLLTHLIVKEDSHSLYGFVRDSDRTLFRSLLKISGVGAKLALTILSGANADEFARMVTDGDTAALVRLPGIGKKTAERLIMEMRDKIGDLPVGVGATVAASAGASGSAKSPAAEATDALVALGYKGPEATRLVRAVATTEMDAEAIIRAALKSAVSR